MSRLDDLMANIVERLNYIQILLEDPEEGEEEEDLVEATKLVGGLLDDITCRHVVNEYPFISNTDSDDD